MMSFGQIPMPKSFLDAFDTGMASSQSMFDAIQKNRLTPYEVQLKQAQAKEAEGKAQQAERMGAFMNFIMHGGQDSDPSGTQGQPDQSAPPDQQGGQAPGQAPPQAQQQTQPPNAAPMTHSQLIARANSDQAAHDQATGGNTLGAPLTGNAARTVVNNTQLQPGQSAVYNPQQNSGSVAPTAQAPTAQSPPSAPGAMGAIGQEEVLHKGRPGEDWKDRMDGMEIPGFINVKSNPPVIRDGYLYKTYPSGKETRTKVAEDPEEKQDRLLDFNEKKIKQKSDAVESAKLVDAAKVLQTSAEHIDALHKIYVKNPKLGGLGTGFSNLIGQGGKDVADLVSHSGRLQADLTHQVSQKGGVGVMNLVGVQKPQPHNSAETNQGLIKANAESAMQEFKDVKEQWEALNPNKEFPFKIADLTEAANYGNEDKKATERKGKFAHLSNEQLKAIANGK